jgi:segregation and condensation protein A
MEAVLKQVEEINPISSNRPVTNDTIFELLLNEEDLTWQTLLYELVKTEQMNPWDIDIKVLSKKFISIVKQMKGFDFRISGKIILAAAILLKIKSNRLLLEDITAFDSLISTQDEMYDDGFEGIEYEDEETFESIVASKPKIFPRTPQPRQRKVSIFDLVEALEKALEVKNRRKPVEKTVKPRVHAPKDYKDISLVIGETYEVIKEMCEEQQTNKLTFHDLLATDSKEDKIYTFIPLLHLTNHRKIDIEQEQHFGNIDIHLLENSTIASEE